MTFYFQIDQNFVYDIVDKGASKIIQTCHSSWLPIRSIWKPQPLVIRYCRTGLELRRGQSMPKTLDFSHGESGSSLAAPQSCSGAKRPPAARHPPLHPHA